MRISVLLVDDEELERVLIHYGFSWEEYGFEIIGEASTAKEAIEFVEERKPDVVITDINMPYMDGLDMTEKIKQIHPECSIVVVTGYREFEYAKRAISLSVEDFLLKPINVDEIKKVMLKIKKENEEKITHVSRMESLKKEYMAAENIVMESFFIRLVEGKIKEEDAILKLEKYNKKELLSNCTCVTIRIEENKEIYQKQIINYLIRNIRIHSICFVHYLNDVIVLLENENYSEILQICKQLEIKTNFDNIEIKIGIGTICHGVLGIADTFQKSQTACDASMVMGYDPIYEYLEYEKSLKNKELDTVFDWEGYEMAVSQCMEKEVNQYINQYIELLKKIGRADTDFLKVMMINMLFRGASILKRYGVNLPGIIGPTKFYEMINQVSNINEIKMCLIQNLTYVMHYLENKKYKPQNKLIQEVEKYINHHLSDSKLTLRTIAAEVFMNESYLSRIFKQETGITMTEYIMKKRIETSMIILENKDIKISEVAKRVGFNDAHYFGICFKRIVGKTVSEFRKD